MSDSYLLALQVGIKTCKCQPVFREYFTFFYYEILISGLQAFLITNTIKHMTGIQNVTGNWKDCKHIQGFWEMTVKSVLVILQPIFVIWKKPSWQNSVPPHIIFDMPSLANRLTHINLRLPLPQYQMMIIPIEILADDP